MSYRNSRFTIEKGTKDHSKEILEILEEDSFDGDFSLIYTRRPDPIESYNSEGIDNLIIVCKDNKTGEVAGLGAVIIHELYIKKKINRVGYFTGLRIKKKFRYMPIPFKLGYQLLGDYCKETNVKLIYTTILKDNQKVIKMLTKKRKHFPDYNFLRDYKVAIIKTGLRKKKLNGFEFRKASDADLVKLDEFVINNGYKRDFFPKLNVEELIDNFYIVLNVEREIVACGYVCDQRNYKQYIVTNYKGIYKVASYVSKLLKHTKLPKLPDMGKIIKVFNLSNFLVESDDPVIRDYFLRNISNTKNNYDFFTFGTCNDERPKIPHILYESKVYLVSYDEMKYINEFDSIHIECEHL